MLKPKHILCIMLSLIILSTSVFASTDSDKTMIWSRNLLLNSTFEKNISNITVDFGTATHAISAGVEGSNALLITQNVSTAAYTRYSIVNGNELDLYAGMNTITKYVGRRLKVSALAKNKSNVPNMFIILMNATTGAVLTSESFSMSDSSWTQITKEFTIPSDVGSDIIRIYITPDTIANRATDAISYYLDNVELYDLRNEYEYGNGVLDSSCENISAFYTAEAKQLSLDTTEKHSGNGSIKISPASYGEAIFGTSYPFYKGETYRLSLWVKPSVNLTKLIFQTRYFKNDGTMTSEPLSTPLTLEGINWQRVNIILTCPESLELNRTLFRILLANNDSAYFNSPMNFDDVEIRKIPKDISTISLKEISPQADSTNVSTNTKIELTFDGEVDLWSVTPNSVTINDKKLSIIVDKTFDPITNESKLFISLPTPLLNDTQYKVAIPNVQGVFGNSAGSYTINFTTIGKITLDKKFYFLDGEQTPITSIRAGNIKAEFGITNNTSDNINVVMVMALCKGKRIIKSILSQKKSIAANMSDNLDATINNVPSGHYIRVFMLNDVVENRPLTNYTTLSE